MSSLRFCPDCKLATSIHQKHFCRARGLTVSAPLPVTNSVPSQVPSPWWTCSTLENEEFERARLRAEHEAAVAVGLAPSPWMVAGEQGFLYDTDFGRQIPGVFIDDPMPSVEPECRCISLLHGHENLCPLILSKGLK